MTINSERVLNFMKENYGKEFSKQEIADALGISISVLMPHEIISVNDVMKHRSQVSMIKEEADYNEVIEQFLSSGFSTLTVYSGNRENVVGVLNYKKVLFFIFFQNCLFNFC